MKRMIFYSGFINTQSVLRDISGILVHIFHARDFDSITRLAMSLEPWELLNTEPEYHWVLPPDFIKIKAYKTN